MFIGSRQTLLQARPRLFLDGHSDVAACYSLRCLRTSYRGALIRVRRSSDNAETDIHADRHGWLQYAVALGWAAGASLRVVTWYDQSGHARDLAQATAGLQPQLIWAANNRPALLFDGESVFIRSSAFTLTQPRTRYALFRMVTLPAASEGHILAGHLINDAGVFFNKAGSANTTNINAGNTLSGGATAMPIGQRGVISGVYNGASSRIDLDGAEHAFNIGEAGSNTQTGLTIGKRGDSSLANFANVEFQELTECEGAHTVAFATDRRAAMRAAWGF